MKIATVAYLVRDYDDAIMWFTEKLGFVLIEDSRISETKRWVVVAPKGGGAALLLAKAADDAQQAAIGKQSGGRVFLFIESEDFDRDYRAMTAKGVTFLESPRLESYGKVAVFEDFNKMKWDLIERS